MEYSFFMGSIFQGDTCVEIVSSPQKQPVDSVLIGARDAMISLSRFRMCRSERIETSNSAGSTFSTNNQSDMESDIRIR